MSKLSVGGVIVETGAVVRRHLAAFGTLAAALLLLPALAVRIVMPEMMAVKIAKLGAPPPPMPTGFWPVLIGMVLPQLIAAYTIIAIAADPDEGGGEPLGRVVLGTLPAIGKTILAYLLFMLAYLVAAVALGIIGSIIAIIVGASGGLSRSNVPMASMTSSTAATIAIITIVVSCLLLWLGARLSPLAGVYLRERIGVIPGIKRAWALSRDATGTILLLLLVLVLVALPFVAMSVWAGLASQGGAGPGLVGFASALIVSLLGALLAIYQYAGVGVVYRQLRAAEGV